MSSYSLPYCPTRDGVVTEDVTEATTCYTGSLSTVDWDPQTVKDSKAELLSPEVQAKAG